LWEKEADLEPGVQSTNEASVASHSVYDNNSVEHEGGYYYDLFKFFSDEHDLILVDTEIQDIIHAVNKFQNGKD
jgi:hypothetical protein